MKSYDLKTWPIAIFGGLSFMQLMTLISVLVVGGAPGVLHASEHPCSQMLESRYEEFRKAHGSWTKVGIDNINLFSLLKGRPIKLYNKSLGLVVAEGTIGIGTGVRYNPYWVSDFNDDGSSTYIDVQIMSSGSLPVKLKEGSPKTALNFVG